MGKLSGRELTLMHPPLPLPRCGRAHLLRSAFVGLGLGLWPGPAALAAETGPGEPPLAVEIVIVTTTTQAHEDRLTGEIVARDSLSAAFPASGRIESVSVEAGDRVAAGAELARIESVQQEQALRAAEAGLSTAAADRAQAAEDRTRQDTLFARGATTRIARDTAEDALRIADGVLAQARADFDRARKALDDTVLSAPAAATVIARMVDPGQVVGAAQPAITLAIGEGFDAVFAVPEVLVTGTDAAAPRITLELLDRAAPAFGGTVREVSPLVDPASGTVAVTVAVEDPPAGLNFGDAVRGTARREAAARIALPARALTATAAGPAVWRVDPASGAVHLVPVTIERHQTDLVILAPEAGSRAGSEAGLEVGAAVVGAGAHLLYPGRIVRAAPVTR